MTLDRTAELERAEFAFSLAKWMSLDGTKFPQTEEGIKQHKALVKAYEAKYGVEASTYEYFYQAIRLGLAQERKDAERNIRILREAKEAAAKREAERAKQIAIAQEIIEANRVKQEKRSAQRIVRLYPKRIAGRQRVLDRLKRKYRNDKARVEELEEKLKTDAYRRSSLYRALRRCMVDARIRVDRYTAKMARMDYDLRDLKLQLQDAKEVLGFKEAVAAKPKIKPQVALKQKVESKVEWHPIWNKAPFAKFRELQNIPDRWNVDKVVLIWRGEDRQDVRVFGSQTFMALRGLFGSTDIPSIKVGLKRADYKLTRAQYDMCG